VGVVGSHVLLRADYLFVCLVECLGLAMLVCVNGWCSHMNPGWFLAWGDFLGIMPCWTDIRIRIGELKEDGLGLVIMGLGWVGGGLWFWGVLGVGGEGGIVIVLFRFRSILVLLCWVVSF